MPSPYLITYDVRHPRRLVRLHRRLKAHAMAVQYSVFFAELTDAGLRDVVAVIESTIERDDDVRIYPLPRSGWGRAHGRPLLPSGVDFTSLPQAYSASPRDGGLGAEDAPEPAAESAEEPISHPRVRLTRHQKRLADRDKARVQTGDRRGIMVAP